MSRDRLAELAQRYRDLKARVQLKHPTDGDATNLDRAIWAQRAVEAFALQTGQVEEVSDDVCDWDDGCLGEVVGDLIADLFHLARVNDVDPADLVTRAAGHYLAEVREDEDTDDPDVRFGSTGTLELFPGVE